MAQFREGPGLTCLPHYRRAMIETRLPSLAHELGVEFSIEEFPGTTDTFVMLHLPNGVQLIVCYVRNKNDAVRYAVARELLSQESNQPYLIEPAGHSKVLPPNLFAILTHNAAENDKGTFDDAVIMFPSVHKGVALGELNVKAEAERVQREEAAAATAPKRTIEVKVKKGG